MRIRRRHGLLLAVAATATAVALSAQGFRFRGGDVTTEPNPRYDGRFTFARIRYEGYGGMTNEGPGWMHDYPRGERNLMKIMSEISTMKPRLDSSVVLSLGDPELFKYPVAYMSEPGYWQPSEADVEALRRYLEKGGFIIFDDFRREHWYNFEEQMRRVLPQARLVPLELSDPVFDSFFRIETLEFVEGNFNLKAEFFGIYEDNDPKKRLLAVANYNNDIGDYWQWSDQGFAPIEITNEAYKFGVNYVMYAMTH